MSVTQFRLARACRRERHVLQAIRLLAGGSDTCALFTPECEMALATLVRAAQVAGYAIQPTDNEYISQDERALIGWIALLQRDCCDVSGIRAPELYHALRAVAEHLKPSHLLPYQAMFKAAPGLKQAPTEYRAQAQTLPNGDLGLGQPVLHQTIRARAVAFARRHGRVSAKQLSEIGVTSPYLKALRERGALIRVQQGIYEAPAPGSTRPEANRQTPGARVGSRQRWGLAAIQKATGKVSPHGSGKAHRVF